MLVRIKSGAYVPADPEDEQSSLKPVASGALTLIPEGFKLEKESFELIQKINIKKTKSEK